MKRTRLNKKGKSSVSQLRRKCDALLQEKNKRENKKCEVCGKPNQIAHHFVPKAESSRLRYDDDNIVSLCHNCHFKHHIKSDPSIHAIIIEYRGQGWYDELEQVRREFTKCNVAYYENILDKYE